MNLKKVLTLAIMSLFTVTLMAQSSEEQVLQSLMNLEDNQDLKFDVSVSVSDPIIISDVKGAKITGSGSAELKTFNNIPSMITFKNCEGLTLANIKMRVGVKNMGGPIIKFENCRDILLDNLTLGNYANKAIVIDTLSTGIKIFNSDISECHETGMEILSSDVEIRHNKFSNNSQIGRFKPDLKIELKEGYPIVRYNNYRVSDYVKHKTTVDEFVESRNTLKYNFDCWKIVKKYEKSDGSEGKLTAFYEGENNKILDKIESDYKGPKGQITATVYFLYGNAVYTQYEVRKGKIQINYLVYGDFLDHLERADSKSAPHVAGDPESNKRQYDQWLDVIESWKAYINDEAEEFGFYENKDEFMPLPY